MSRIVKIMRSVTVDPNQVKESLQFAPQEMYGKISSPDISKQQQNIECTIILSNAEDRILLKKVFDGAFILMGDENDDVYQLIEATPFGLVVAKCHNMSKKSEPPDMQLKHPLETTFIYNMDIGDDSLTYSFASQYIRDHYDEPIDVHKILFHVLHRNENSGDIDQKLKKVLGLPINNRSKMIVDIPREFFLDDVQLHKEVFLQEGFLSQKIMDALLHVDNKYEEVQKTLRMFGIPSTLKLKYIKQLFHLSEKKGTFPYIIDVWEMYLNKLKSAMFSRSFDHEQALKIGVLFVTWFKESNVTHDRIEEFQQLQQFHAFSKNKKKRKHAFSGTPLDEVALLKLKEQNLKKQKLIEELKKANVELKRKLHKKKAPHSSSKKKKTPMNKVLINTSRLLPCPKCKKAKGICNRRGQPGHLPKL